MSQTLFYPTIGTISSPFYIPITASPITTYTDQGYFYVQVFGAQAAFTGNWFTGAQNLTIISQVNLHLDDASELGKNNIRSILQLRELAKDNAVQLGFSPVIIDFVPAKMKKVSVSIEYLVHTKNYLKDLAGIITDKTLLSTIAFAPGAAMVAKTVSRFTEKLVDSFIPSSERKPILQFSGDFELSTEGLKEGYYVILGSHHQRNPLPKGDVKLEVADGGRLIMNNEEVTQLSYVILKVGCVRAIRDRIQGHNPWQNKLREVKHKVEDYKEDPFADSETSAKKEFWEKECLPLLREALVLLKEDHNFLDNEADLIYRSTYKECLDLIVGKTTERFLSGGDSLGGAWIPDIAKDKKFLGIGKEEDLDHQVRDYADQLYHARNVFKNLEP